LNLEVRSSLGFNQRQSAAGRKRNAKKIIEMQKMQILKINIFFGFG
jgi:hypothetical protein